MPCIPSENAFLLILYIHGKNGFAELSKIVVRYKSENNFVWTIKIIYRKLKLVARMLKLFAASTLKCST